MLEKLPKDCPLQEICAFIAIPSNLRYLYWYEQRQLIKDYETRTSINLSKWEDCLNKHNDKCSMTPGKVEAFFDQYRKERFEELASAMDKLTNT